MSEWTQSIVDRDVSATKAQDLANRMRDWLISTEIILPEADEECVLTGVGYPPGDQASEATDGDDSHEGVSPNGMEIVVERYLFGTTDGPPKLKCQKCRKKFEVNFDEDGPWSKATAEWEAGSAGLLACPKCGVQESVSEWSHDPPWGFGNLGFTFWNWGPLSKSFLKAFEKRLGHRTILVTSRF